MTAADLTEKVIDPTATSNTARPEPSTPDPAKPGEKPAETLDTKAPGIPGSLELPPELKAKLGKQIDRLAATGLTAVGRRSNPNFELPLSEIETLGWGDCVVELVVWYLPMLPLDSPWPPLVLASLGVGSVMAAKLAATPKPKPKPTATKKPAEETATAKPEQLAPERQPDADDKPLSATMG